MAHIQTQEEWEAEMSGRILAYIRDELYLELRFLDIALSALTPQAESGVRTFATDGTRLLFSAEQVLRVFRGNELFLKRAYLHVVLHCIFSHLWTGGEREPYLWNIACDIAVEYTIDGLGKKCTKRILSWQRQRFYGLLAEEAQGVSAAVVYRLLREMSQEEDGGERLAQLQREFYTDDHRYWPKRQDGAAKRAAHAAAEKRWNRIARQAKLEADRRGGDPGQGGERLFAGLSAERGRRSYREFLKKFAVLREELHCDPDEFDLNYYAYGLAFYGNLPLIEPLESREVKKIREFVIVIDTSDSTSGELVGQFLRETAGILTQDGSFFSDSVIRVLQCDNRVRGDARIAGKRELERFLTEFRLLGGGGTDFRPAFAYVNDLVERGELRNLTGLLYFTDGKGIYPKKRPDYRAAFLFLEDYDETAVPPWAMRLRLEPESFWCP